MTRSSNALQNCWALQVRPTCRVTGPAMPCKTAGHYRSGHLVYQHATSCGWTSFTTNTTNPLARVTKLATVQGLAMPAQCRFHQTRDVVSHNSMSFPPFWILGTTFQDWFLSSAAPWSWGTCDRIFKNWELSPWHWLWRSAPTVLCSNLLLGTAPTVHCSSIRIIRIRAQ